MARIMLADDHPLFLQGISRFLTAHDHEVVCIAKSASEVLALVTSHRLDVLILDVSMKDGTGVEVLAQLRDAGSRIPVIFMTVSIDPAMTVEALKYGVNAIVLKDGEPEELCVAINKVLDGQTCIDATVSERALMHSVADKGRSLSAHEQLLTDREKHIAALLREGLRNNEIAMRSGLAEGTVKVHLHNIFQKLGVKSRAELIARAQRNAA